MNIVTSREQYEGAELVGIAGEWVIFRTDNDEDDDPPTNFAVPARHVLEIEFETADEVDEFRQAYPMGFVDTRTASAD